MSVHQILLVAGLAVLLSGQAESQEVNIVVPNDLATVEGNSSSGGFVNPYRSQTLFPASEFEDLPAGKYLITQIFWRPDEAVSFPIIDTSEYELRLSTSTVPL